MKRSVIGISCIIFVLTFASCHQTTVKKYALKKNVIKDSSIISLCAVVINPTAHQIDSMKSRPDSADFYTAADDNMYYISDAIHYLDSIKVKQIVREAKGSLTFKTQSGQTFKFRLDTLYWNILLFNGKDRPISADITDIDMSYKRHMKK